MPWRPWLALSSGGWEVLLWLLQACWCAKMVPQSRSHLGELPVLAGAACWVYGGMEAASEVLAWMNRFSKAGPQGQVRAHSFMQVDGETQECFSPVLGQLGRRRVGFSFFFFLRTSYNSSIPRESYTKSLPFDIHLKISQKSPLLTQILFKVLPLCWNSE